MILGYILLDEGGTPILEEILTPLTTKDGRGFFSTLLSTTSELFRTMLKSRIKYISLKNMHFYLGYGKRNMIIVISDVRNDELEEAINKIIEFLEESEIDPLQIQFSSEIAEAMKERIRELLFGSPPKIGFIVGILAEMIKRGIISVQPSEPDIREDKAMQKIRTAPSDRGEKTIEDLVKAFHEGNLIEVIRTAPLLFHSDDAELAKILYIKAGLIFHLSSYETGLSFLRELEEILKGVKTEFPRRFLEAEINSTLDVSSYIQLLRAINEVRFELDNVILRHDKQAQVYRIMLIKTPLLSFLIRLEEYYKNRSSFLYNMTYEEKVLMILERVIEEDISLFSLLTMLQDRLNKALKRRDESIARYYHMLLRTIIDILLTSNITYEEGSEWIYMLLNSFEKNWKNLNKLKNQPNASKFASLYLMYGVLYRLLLEAGDPKAKKMVNHVANILSHSIEKLLSVKRKRKIEHIQYLTILTGLLSMLARVYVENKRRYPSALNCLTDAVDLEMEQLWFYNKPYYLQYYTALLDTIGHLLILSDRKDTSFQKLTYRIIKKLRKIGKEMAEYPFIRIFTGIRALNLYRLMGLRISDQGINEVAELVKRKASPFITEVVNNMISEK
ncbi:MAG: hypothetical protein ACTSUJ_05060 [Candidatus Njordarchaeales archaeon]